MSIKKKLQTKIMKKILAFVLFTALSHLGFAQSSDMQASIAAIKKNLSESGARMRSYEWIETTTVYYKGEVKSTTTKQCFYGADGKLNKVAIGEPAKAAKTPGGLRGKAAANKKEDIDEYMEKCVEKIHAYLPPKADKIQAIVASGKAVISPLGTGKVFKVDLPDYLQPGDKVSMTIDNGQGLLKEMGVSSFIKDKNDKVSVLIKYSSLPDMTSFPGETTLDAPSQKVKVVITNTSHKNAAVK
jgi:hypothetical protein